ncbi:minor capsid protein [Caulobacter phage CcrSC]|uniref:Minor capsid protein n=1 Tax=Caulobacter phage CcrSC TaxID=2283272 RepID=A0A385EFS1_9CAUD|nr:minor capsid protein [Caulobacter phage CcrSC]AXQ69702.1 minor capsid protein [Caulobacter phage CcrSC]
MESAVRHQYDASLALQAIGSAAVTATAVGTGKISLQRLTAGRGDLANRYGQGAFDVVAYFSALDTTSGNETYELQFCTYDAAGANETVVEKATITAAQVGEVLEFKFQPITLQKFDADAAQFGVKLVVAGTTPSATYYAFASQDTH